MSRYKYHPESTPLKPSAAEVLNVLPAEIISAWLELSCSNDACRMTVQWPLRMMAEAYPGRTLGSLLPKLCCRRCRSKPRLAVLREQVNTHGVGQPYGWSMQLIPEISS